MKRYLLMAIVVVVLVVVILLAAPLLQKDEPETPAPDCLTSFMSAWSVNYIDNMLASCSPEWKAQQGNPEYQMFVLAANRAPSAWHVGAPEQDGDALVYPVDVNLARNGAKANWQRFRLTVVTENGQQYVVPDGLAKGEKVSAPKTFVTP